MSGVLDSTQLSSSHCHDSLRIRFTSDAVSHAVLHFYSDYANVKDNIFSTPVTLNRPLHSLSDTSHAYVKYVTSTNISWSDCNRYYKQIVSLFEDTIQGKFLIEGFPKETTFNVYCDNVWRQKVLKDGWVRAFIAQECYLVNNSDCLRYPLQLFSYLLYSNTITSSSHLS